MNGSIQRNRKLAILVSSFLVLLNLSPLAHSKHAQALDVYGKECINIKIVDKSTTDLPPGWSYINVLNKCIGNVDVQLCPVKYSQANCISISAFSGNNHYEWAHGRRFFYSSVAA